MMHGGWMWGDGYGWGGWGWGGWILMALVMIVFWALVISAIVLAVRYFTAGGTAQRRAGGWPTPTGGRAEDLLTERYARGEIDDDEYRQRLARIREHR